MIIRNYSALQSHPPHWGPRLLEWEPSDALCLTPTQQQTPCTPYPLPNQTLTPHKVKYFTPTPQPLHRLVEWRAQLPGQEFSQVGFVVVMAGLFREARSKPVLKPGEQLHGEGGLRC